MGVHRKVNLSRPEYSCLRQNVPIYISARNTTYGEIAMKKVPMNKLLVVSATCFVFLLSTSLSSADGRGNRIRTRLSGLNEVPSIITDASGELELTIQNDQITFELKFQNLSANLAASHIHIGQRGANGGVSAFFCGGGGQPDCPAATSGTITGTITAANVIGPAGQGVNAGEFAKLVRAIRSGVAYANAHNARFPGGEMRGQLGGGDDQGDDDDDH